MRRRRISAALVACGVVPILLASLSLAAGKKKGDPIADLRNGIQSEVSDPARASRMSASVDEMEKLVREIGSLATEQRGTLAPMLRDYRTERKDVETKLAEVEARRTALARKVLELHVAFKAEATPEEWKKLRKAEEQALLHAAATSLGDEPAAKEK